MPPPSSLRHRLDTAVAGLTPGYFALVMATGIVSVGMRTNGWLGPSVILLVIAAIAYALLIALNAIRVIRHRDKMAEDFADPARAFGFFTFVAATCVLGSRLCYEQGFQSVAVALLMLGSLAWILLGYTVPWTAVLGDRKTTPMKTANGTWFIWAVASQSIAVLAATLEVEMPAWRPFLALLAVFSWSVGIFLYCAVGVFVAVRMLTYRFGPEDLTPPYWVAMGATAITVVAAARIVEMADAPMVDATRGLIAGAAVFFWSFGTWLIPPLIIAGLWRHVIHRLPFRYEATLWSIIFPLGMYGVGSQFLGTVDSLPIVHGIGYIESWVAMAAWTLTFIAMLATIWRTVLRRPQPPGRGWPEGYRVKPDRPGDRSPAAR